MRNLLVIDDDKLFCSLISDHFSTSKLKVLIAESASEGLAICQSKQIDILLLDQKLPDGNGHDFCPDFLKTNEQMKIIFITAHSSFDSALKAIKFGAHDYLTKPFELEALEYTIEKALRTLELEQIEDYHNFQRLRWKNETRIIGKHPVFEEIRKLINVASRSDAPVLITGETGTGKTVIAKNIHYQSLFAQGPFIPVNCSSLPETLFEAELFGYERGAFTDAHKRRKGFFAMAEGGTLLLDEIGNMPIHLQSKLLSVIDEKKFKRLGSETFIQINVRIIAATNTMIEDAIQNKTFREDLFYRLNVIRIHVPPLRDRISDIPALCEYFLHQIDGDNRLKIPQEEYFRLMEYKWPGNIRELKNVIERSVILKQGNILKPSELIHRMKVSLTQRTPSQSNTSPNSFVEIKPIRDIEKEYLQKALFFFSGNLTRTAKALGISLSTLKRKIKRYKLSKHI